MVLTKLQQARLQVDLQKCTRLFDKVGRMRCGLSSTACKDLSTHAWLCQIMASPSDIMALLDQTRMAVMSAFGLTERRKGTTLV